MSRPTRILIVDDHPVFRRGMASIIEEDSSLDVVAQAGNGEEALQQLNSHLVDVAVVDFTMPGMSGLDLTAHLLARTPPINVVLLTMHDSEKIFNAALDSGVAAYILKDDAESGIVEGIHSAACGENYVTPSLSKHLMRRGRKASRFREEVGGLDLLTPTEIRVLKEITHNQTSREIACVLGVSPRTIESHRSNICEKFELHGNNSLLEFALENKSEILAL